MRIGITGATGFIGGELTRLARARGDEIVAFSRHPRPDARFIEVRCLATDEPPNVSELDALVHLAGETILGIWTPPKKRRIRGSRVEGTKRIVEALDACAEKPAVFVCGSAIGYYGDTGDSIVDESSPAGTGFLAEVAREWEAESQRARDIRVVNIRTGLVIGNGGAMKLMGPVFRTGLGGRLGNGRQWMSCIHVTDVAGMILHAIDNVEVSGPLNAVMPEPVRNEEFTRTLASVVGRPAILPAPSLALKVALGEASQLLLGSQRVRPLRAIESGFQHRFPDLRSALADVLK